jgi:2-keto-4-pentenoate hydratase
VELDRLIAPLLECEVAFVLGADLPPRAAPYQASEVAAAIAEVVPVMEIVDSRIPPEASDYLRLADAMANGAFVTGTPLKNWQAFDLDHLAITLAFDTALTEEGNSDRIPGGPFGAVVAIANAQPLPAGGLKRGQIVTTGTCTTPAEITKGTYLADFGPLGTVQASFI